MAAREAAGSTHLKVILETGELGSYDRVRQASMLAMAAGADFIKTSTGKIGVSATLPTALCMMEAARDFHAQTGRRVGVKVAGGVRRAKQAIQYLVLVHETLGPDWMTPGAVPDRGLEPAERRADAAREGAHRPLLWAGLLHDRLRRRRTTSVTDAIERPAGAAPPWEYASAPESTDVVRLEDRYGLFIGGEFVEPKSGRWFPTISPSTEETARRGGRGRRGRRRTCGRRRARRPAPAWRALARPSARSTCSASRGSCRSEPASSPCSRR